MKTQGQVTRYKFGEITLTGAQFKDWTGFENAKGACEFFASGGIPASVNGSTTACPTSGTVSTVTLAHVWVEAVVGSQTLLFDPSYKAYDHIAGLDVRSLSGYSAGSAMTTGAQGVSRTDSGKTTQGYNGSGLKTLLDGKVATLRSWMSQSANRGLGVDDIVGGRRILSLERPSGGWVQTSLAHVSNTRATWSGGVPDIYRTTLTLNFTDRGGGTAATANFFTDEIYGRRLEVQRLNGPAIWLDQVLITEGVSGTGSADTAVVTLTANRPFAALSGTYGDTVSSHQFHPLYAATVAHAWGTGSGELSSKWARENTHDGLAGQTFGINDRARALLWADWLAQFSRAADLHGELAESRVSHLHTLGLVHAISNLPPWLSGQPDDRTDVTDVMDLTTTVSVTSREDDAAKRRAMMHALAATAATLEGSVAEQSTDSPDSSSTARRVAWANAANDEAEVTPKFYAIAASGSVPTGFSHGGTDFDSSSVLISALTAYSNNGFATTTASDVNLGPGGRIGTQGPQGIPPGPDHMPSTQRGGAFVATKYDSNGDPVAIAHVVTNYYTTAKGGGGAQPTTGAPDPAERLKDKFVDRSTAMGVNLSSGQTGFTSPGLTSIGQGDFPDMLEERLEMRGDALRSIDLVSRDWNAGAFFDRLRVTSGMASNFDGSINLSNSGLQAMGDSRPEAAAGTIVGFMVQQDVYAATASGDRDIVGLLVSDWWGRRLVQNVVTVLQGGSAEQYVDVGFEGSKRMFGSTSGGTARVLLEGQRRILRPTRGLGQSGGGPSWSPERFFVDDQLSFEVISHSGDRRTYEYWPGFWYPDTVDPGYKAGFRLKHWTFAKGVELTLTYPSFSTASVEYVVAPPMIPLTVTSNLGISLPLSSYPRDIISGTTSTLVANWPCGKTPTSQPATDFHFTGNGGEGHLVVYRRPVPRTVNQRPDDGCRIEEIQSLGRTGKYTYDSIGRVKEARDAVSMANLSARGSHKFYIAEGFRGEREDPLGGQYSVRSRDGGRETRHTDEMNRVSRSTVDGRGRLLTRTSAWGDTTSFKYDERDNLIETTQTPISGCATGLDAWQQSWWCQTVVIKAEYHSTWNKPTKVTLPATTADPVTRDWTMTYNSQGLLYQTTGPQVWDAKNGVNDNAVWSVWYDAYGRVTKTKDPTGVEATQTWGGGGLPAFCLRETRNSTQLGGLNLPPTTFVCDVVGNVTSVTDPGGHTTIATWDSRRRKVSETGPAGTNIQTQWVYDAAGDLVQVKRWDHAASTWRTSTTTWSATHQPLTVSDPSGDLTRTCYDALDRPIAVIDPMLRAQVTDYNLAGQPTAVRRWRTASTGSCTTTAAADAPSEERWRRFGYNAGGLLNQETDARGNVTMKTYDGLGRATRTTFADSTEAWVLMDQRGQVVVKKQRGGTWAALYYDAMGRDFHVQEFDNGSTGFKGRNTRGAYDLAGRPIWRDVSTQVLTTGVFEDSLLRDVRGYGYDPAGRLTTDQVKPEGTGSGALTLTLGYGYNDDGLRATITWPGSWTATYGFDAAHRPASVSFPGGGGTQTVNLAHDSLSRRTGIDRPGSAADTTYTYEPDNDLASLGHGFANGAGPSAVSFTYTHDVSAKVKTVAIDQPAFEWMPTIAYARAYGTPTNLNQILSETDSTTSRALTFDPNGNLSQEVRTTSAGTTARTYTWTYGNRLIGVSEPGMTASYAYDSDDRRTKKIVGGVTTRMLWSGADELAELDASGTTLRRFIPDGSGGMDARLATVEADGSVYWIHTDHQGSVIATSNSTGQVVEAVSYSPYGEFGSGQSAPPAHSPFGYTGRQYDPETGLYQYRARYYSSRLGQFLSTDPIGTKDDPNLYMYVGLDPVSRTDPTGMETYIVSRRIFTEQQARAAGASAGVAVLLSGGTFREAARASQTAYQNVLSIKHAFLVVTVAGTSIEQGRIEATYSFGPSGRGRVGAPWGDTSPMGSEDDTYEDDRTALDSIMAGDPAPGVSYSEIENASNEDAHRIFSAPSQKLVYNPVPLSARGTTNSNAEAFARVYALAERAGSRVTAPSGVHPGRESAWRVVCPSQNGRDIC